MARQRPSTAVALGAVGAAACGLALAGSAAAADVGCMFENGALVVPAALDEAGGDWIIDVAAPVTQLHETRAQMEGVEGDATVGVLSLAGERLQALPTPVANLDDRAPGFTTPIVGIIGEDVLSRYVVDISFAPCRVTLHTPGTAPPLRGVVLPLSLVAGRPTIQAAVSDGRRALAGPFVIDTASKAAVRLAIQNPAPTDTGDPRQAAPTWIRALSVAGVLYERPSAARGAELPPQVVGALGTALLSRYRLRLDVPGGRLTLAPLP